jgi:hypothetical protein
MSLFQKSVLKSYLKQQDDKVVTKAYKKFSKYFHDFSIQQNIFNIKEEQFQEGFLRELFVKVLGYTLNPNPNYNLSTEFKNEKDAKKADGAILRDGKAVAVIELKGTKTKRLEDIRKQAFDYKANQTGCTYVITSNFQKLRFYINDAVEYEEFNLFTITQDEFRILFLCLAKDNILSNLPLEIKELSIHEDELITSKLYADYSTFKRELYRDLVKLNMKNDIFRKGINAESINDNKNIKLVLFKKSQKLLDRFLFIFFAEDKGLLPANSSIKILEQWDKLKELDEIVPLYNRYKKYFNYLDKGRNGNGVGAEIYAYNGGLFKPDAILDSLLISNSLLYDHTKKLSNYDYESQVDVNILGHIFENSLNELESVNAEILGKQFDKQKSKRKKDGVYYTPIYITKHIVNNTIGKICSDKKLELGIIESQYYSKRQQKTKDQLLGNLEKYRSWLLQLTVIDPACGSGAFLNEALDFLIKEHEFCNHLHGNLLGGALLFDPIDKKILENNIYGVDINDESVDIAKLSLWLRTAQPRRKLNDLSNNIKCGNSLVDNNRIAGSKSFKWEDEFPQVFKNGGFDVVIGNPPYGAQFSDEEIQYFNKEFNFQSYQLDSYLLFTERITTWLKKDGYAGYIMPNTWLSSLFGSKIRQYVLGNLELIQLIHYNYFVFKDATVETDTYIFKNSIPDKDSTLALSTVDGKSKEANRYIKQYDWINLKGEPINIFECEQASAIRKRLSSLPTLGERTQIVQGTKPFQKGKGLPKQTEETMLTKPFVSDYKRDDSFVPLLRGSLINKYVINWQLDYWISYGDWLAEPRYSAKFNCEEKLIVRQTGDSLIATYDNMGFIARDNLYIIRDDHNNFNLKGLLAVINSKFMNWYFQNILNPERGKAMAQVKKGHLTKLPLINSNFEKLSDLTDSILISNVELQSTVRKFINYLKTQFKIEITKKLQSWHQLEFGEFIDEINSCTPTILTRVEEMEWMDVFDLKKSEVLSHLTKIKQKSIDIDLMVYEMYDLSDDEITFISNS